MVNISYTILRRRQKMYINVYAVLCLIVLLSMGFYSFQKWQEYSVFRDAVASNEEFKAELSTSAANEEADYASAKDDFDELNEEISDRLEYIFPSTDDYTNLTRQIDAYEDELSARNNPFEVSNIDYQEPVETEYYSVLPLRMNIRSSAGNFTNFLHLIENSGALNGEVRLMDLSSIRLNFEGTGTGTGPEIINFTVQINAYFQKT